MKKNSKLELTREYTPGEVNGSEFSFYAIERKVTFHDAPNPIERDVQINVVYDWENIYGGLVYMKKIGVGLLEDIS